MLLCSKVCLVTGLNEEMHQAMQLSLPQIQYAMEGDEWFMTIITSLSTMQYKFKPWDILNTISIDGKPIKVIVGCDHVSHELMIRRATI